MKNNEVVEILKKVGAFITDKHLVYTSRKHGTTYINKDALYPHTHETSQVCRMIAEKHKNLDIDVIVGPALGGIILSQWTAYHLTDIKGKEVFGVYTDKTPELQQIFKRGYDRFVINKNVLVVEDITTTGGSIKKVIDCVKATRGRVVAACSLVNRDQINVTPELLGVPFSSLATFNFPAYDEELCPMCKANIPIDTMVGYGRQYLEEKKQKKAHLQ